MSSNYLEAGLKAARQTILMKCQVSENIKAVLE